jgi:hypothetical protein
MVSLLDIGPLTKKVPIRGQQIEVKGISALAVFTLLSDIPELRKVVAEKGMDPAEVMSLIGSIPQAIGKIIAAATGHLGDADHIQAAINLTAGEQQELLSAIIELTFPRGLKSFIDGLLALVPPGALGWDQATKSPAPSKDASQQDTTSETAGDTPQGNSPPGTN